MSTTPVKPRVSALPTPGRTGIPTPGRSRASSSAASTYPPPVPTEAAILDRAFQEVIQYNDTSRLGVKHPSGRPSSAASNARPKTPTSSYNKNTNRRPESRQSDVFSQTQRFFEVGDFVRIESLGYEGRLAYLGEIVGKQGVWAGVQLSGGFAGKGKNNGSVNGTQYFACEPKCGVFVATNKLSAPTVGPGFTSRPSSVASSRASLTGRMTPSFFGQSTSSSSLQNGRVTPSFTNGRVTPSSFISSIHGFQTPGTRPRAASRTSQRAPLPALNTPSASAMSKITAGGRASKYIGMTAKQLQNRDKRAPENASPTREMYSTLSSPVRSIGSISPSRISSATTPKPIPRLSGIGTPKTLGTGLHTPRPRIPSAIAMPPPPSPSSGNTSRSVSLTDKPITPTFSSTSNDTAVDDDALPSLASIQLNSQALQDKIRLLTSGKLSPSSGPDSPPNSMYIKRNDESHSAALEKLQQKVDMLERENLELKLGLEKKPEIIEDTVKIDALTAERKELIAKIADLESQLKASQRSLNERDSKLDLLQHSLQDSTDSLERLRLESDTRQRDLQSKLEDANNLISSLKEAVEVKANEAGHNEGIIQAKNTEIALLEGQLRKATVELEETRQELGGQVDLLRQAGQETIAIYQERLNAASAAKYELEDQINELQEHLKSRERPLSPTTTARYASEAARIDNEALKEQVAHLQSKIGILEGSLEDLSVNAEREEAVLRARLARYKENEAQLKREIGETRKEIDRLIKVETAARGRTEEVEEALRENTLALENARAEIEGLRADIENLESLQSGDGAPAEDSVRRAAAERRYNEEITQLKELLESAQAAKRDASDQLTFVKSEVTETARSLMSLRKTIETLDAEKAELEHNFSEQQTKLEHERALVTELRRVLEQKSVEFDTARKSFNRDRPLHGDRISSPSPSPSTSSKYDMQTAREEIMGLKHIIQTLQKENGTMSSQNRLLESENKILIEETEKLKEEFKILEQDIERSLLREESALDAEISLGSQTHDTQKSIDEMKAKHMMELEQLRKKYSETEYQNTQEILRLKKDANELETIIEHKIFQEDVYTEKIKELEEKLSRSKKSSKPSATPVSATIAANSIISGDVCDLCEQPGHEIQNCPVFKSSGSENNGRELFCEDCEGHGHTASNCPHSMDVF